ncbi:hypothetical protein LR48_Vigan10g207000 [Vigna angularis]|uniref:Transposase (putative) gypsy type domain-containing protein n=1 Tax=Phaseolus angularis TaxID=3914 RepID=A0A0L9VMJ3_PHAAN|nr:hypothetical protein LR48_Vigan10g207000 [Vigna angularis]
MASVSIESGSGSSGGVREGSARGDSSDSLSSVSSHFLEEAIGSSGADHESLVSADERIFHGVPLFLLKGGIRVIGSPFEPEGQGVVACDLAPPIPSRYASCYAFRKELEWRIRHTHIVRDVEDSKLILAGVTLLNERVFHDGRSSPCDFFFMYVTFFTHLFIRVPFTRFQMAILREVNVAPTQLHPNSWAAVQAFLAMCLAVGVTPTIPVFFYYFEVRPSRSGGWVSFTSVRGRTLFRPFSDSFKNFKQHYFKIIVDKAGVREFSDSEGRLLFPFYWTRDPRHIRATPIGALTAPDLEAVRTINALPRRISARHLVECLSLEDCGPKAFGVPPIFKTGGSNVEVLPPNPPPELKAAQVGPLSEAATISADLSKRKRDEPTAEGHEYDKRIEQLEADLEKAKRESAEGLAAARAEQERLAEESRQKIELLEAEVTRTKEAESCRAKANEELTLEVAKAKEQIAELESTILFEHEEGFNKALRQVTLLAGIKDPFALGVDIEKDVFNGVLVDLNAVEENEPTVEAAGGGKS